MLALTRRVGESFIINGNIKVTIISNERGYVRVAIDAPKEISIWREEIQKEIDKANQVAPR